MKPGAPAAEWRRFHQLALAVDADPQRTAVRTALLADDRAALLRLAEATAVGEAGSDTLDLLANCLDRAGERRAAIRIWQRANARHPDDVRVIHSLAVHHFRGAECPPWDEVVRLLTAGTALRPHSAHLWTDLAHALLGAGDAAAAEAALQRALELDPGDERAHASLVDLLRCCCRPDDALARSAEVAERASDGAGWRVQGDAQRLEGRLEAAAAAYRRAVDHAPTSYHHERLGQALLALGDAAAATLAFTAALDADPDHASAQVHLGLALRASGDFAGAVQALDRGLELGGATWEARCRQWLAETDRATANVAAATAGHAPAAGASFAEVAAVAHVTGNAPRAARLYREAFAREPKAANEAFLGWHLDRAAQAAAATVATPASAPDEAAAWLDQAVRWLGEAIARVEVAYDTGRETPATVRARLGVWRHAGELAPVLAALRADLDALEARLTAPAPAVTVHAPFDRTFVFRALGRPPGVPAPFGGVLVEAADPDVLLVAAHAQRITAGLYAVGLRRDAAGHVDGFRDDARHFAAAPFADGGLARGPRGTLLYTRYPGAEIGLLPAGSRGPDLVAKLAGPSAGGLALVPPALPGGGRVKVLSWPGGEWSDAGLEVGHDGFTLAQMRQVATLPGGPDGFTYVPAGPEPFGRPALLVAEWSSHTIAAYDVDGNGDPVPATRRLAVSGLRGVLGLAVDPGTGDVLVSTWRGDGTEVLGVLMRRAP